MALSSSWSTYLEQNRTRFLAEFLDLLRIPSVSAQPESSADVRRAAAWTARRLEQAGIEQVQVVETGGHPVVFGQWLDAPGRPTLLFYGHYDVQPAEQLELWTTSPFEPVIRGDRVYARGASDMKGNLLLPIVACEAWLRTAGALPVNVKFLFEGEEEIGSPSLGPFIRAHRDLLAADMMVSADGGQYAEDQPAVTIGMKGLCGLEVSVRSADTDLHSGVMGGMAPNAIHALVRMLASLFDGEGGVAVPGFYDQVAPLSAQDRALMARIPPDEEELRAETGIRDFAGEPGFTARERNWARPTLELNGIWGGYQGEGIKTVIPSTAQAKISCRLVPRQRPGQIRDLVAAHLRRQAPPEVDVSVHPVPDEADPYLMPADHPGLAVAERVLTVLYGRQPYYVREGYTIPVSAVVRQVLGIYTIQLGFGLRDERQHAPDEFMRLSSFERGQRAFGLFLAEAAR